MNQVDRTLPAWLRLFGRLARRPLGAFALGLTLCWLASPVANAANFKRGDTDGNSRLEMADAIRTFGFLFLGSPTSLGCLDAADTNDSGKVDLSDGVTTLNFLFTGGPEPAAPGPFVCGPDPSPDSLTCDESPACPGGPTPPSAPTGLSATGGNSQVSLDWANNTEPDLAGYNVYRSTTAGSGHAKINGAPVLSSSYTDSTATNGTRYYYVVTALDAEGSESPRSAEANALPAGPSAPSAPTGLTAVAGSGQVTLDWVNNTEPDLAGYNVYRSTTAGSGHAKINGSPVATSSYTDTSVSNGTRYYYEVTAVNGSGQESPKSLEVNGLPVAPSGDSLQQIGHILNRLTYGPSQAAIDDVLALGIPGYVDLQLHPESIDESANTALSARENALFNLITPSKDTILLPQGAVLRYLKGTAAPPAGWDDASFDDAAWTLGVSGIGYNDGDDATILADMQQANGNPGYISVFVRQHFNLDPSTVGSLILNISYDDGFVAYLNGTEVARRGLAGTPPPFSALATAHEADGFEAIDITNRKNLLVNGGNVLAIQIHNSAITSGDLTLIPILLSREVIAGPQIKQIKNINSLQQLTHVRGVYSEKQLQTVLAEFWDNHFTTDYDKVAQYLDDLTNADGTDAMSGAQAAQEAADLHYRDYQFYYDHALGNFEDLFLVQATSPSMLIYLDNVLNVAGVANENYSREILELFGFGVDNRYVQKDIEQLAKCFTGWSICKVSRDELQAYPESATSPPPVCGVQYQDTVVLARGAGWKYMKGTAEPTPDVNGDPTIAWTTPEFVDTGWLNGSTGIGYGDGDDATVLSDMQNGYRSVYLRRKFTMTQAQIESPDPILLAVDYDDAFVAYLNGVEVGRSRYIGSPGVAPPYTALAEQGHEVSAGTLYLQLNSFRSIMVPGTNVLAIQVHNSSLDSSDLSMIPEIRIRKILGGTDNGDLNGAFTFYFDPSKHDTTQKILFDATPYKITIPAGHTGALGLQDALGPVKAMVTHPSTKEFICIKLIQKFVSDEITVQTKNTAPLPLRSLLADCIAAWGPKGDIRAVLNVIFDPIDRQSEFWSDTNYRTKIRTPTELVNASSRLLDSALSGNGLADVVMGMNWLVFTRDEPDGNEENYARSTDSLKDSIDFGQNLAENKVTTYTWSTLPYLDAKGLDTAQEIVDHFSDVMFHGTLTASDKNLLLQFLTTDANYVPKSLVRSNSADFQTRVQELLGLMLSMPQWQFQ